MSTSDFARAMAWAKVNAAGGLGTVAGLRIAYLSWLIDADEFVEGMERVASPPEIVHSSQLAS